MGRAEERKGSNIYIQGARVPVYQELIVHYDSSWWNGKSEEPSLLFVDSMMNGKQSLTSRFNILSQKVQGLTPEKEDILLELMDQLHLDLVFIPKTFRQPFQGSDPICSVHIKSRILHPRIREPESTKRDSVWSYIVSGTSACTIFLPKLRNSRNPGYASSKHDLTLNLYPRRTKLRRN